jgi:Amt family ammonium transporter
MQDAMAAANGPWGVFDQLLVQVAAVLVALVYAGLGTLLLLWIVNKFVKFRATSEKEMQGLDSAYHGESGYGMLNPN